VGRHGERGLDVRKAGIHLVYSGQQALASGASREGLFGTGITEPGTYRVDVIAQDVQGRTKAFGGSLHVPGTC
jgi:hypothetical protein